MPNLTKPSLLLKLSASFCMAMGVLAPVSALSADSIVVDMTNFAGDDLLARVTLEQVGDDIQVTLETVAEDDYFNTGDWGAFWFNLNDDSFLTGMTVVGDDVTAFDFSGSVGWVGSANNNLNGGGSPGLMDGGVAFGTPGSADGLLEMTVFTLSHEDGLSLSLFDGQTFAGRLQSVGDGSDDDDGEGSSKIVTPEPASVALSLMGLGLLVTGRYRG